jgi:hypothetical protein
MENKEIIAAILASSIFQKHQPIKSGQFLTTNTDKGGAINIVDEAKHVIEIYKEVLGELSRRD